MPLSGLNISKAFRIDETVARSINISKVANN